MGALIFYIAIYFIGYYGAYLLNQMVGHALIRNRRMAGREGRTNCPKPYRKWCIDSPRLGDWPM